MRELPSFKGLSSEHLDVLGQQAAEVTLAAGQVVFRHGGPADAVYLIRDGRIAVEVISPHEGAVVIQTLGAGEVLGFSWLFPPYQWCFDARALDASHAVALDASSLLASCDADPALGYALMKCFSSVMHQHLQAARLQVLDLYGPLAR